MPILRRCTGTVVMSKPSNNIAPESGFSNPAMRFKIVDLPLPVGPIITKIFPFSILRFNGPSVNPGNFFVILTSSSVNL